MTDIRTKVMELLDANCLTDTDSDVATFSVACLIGDITALVEKAERERVEARARALEEAAKFIEDGQSKAYSESVNGAFKVMAFAIRQLKDRAP